MASTSGTAAAAPAQEYKVRVSKPAANKRFSIMKFNANMKLDLAKDGPILMERENNLKQYKNAYDVDIMPKFGAGSEFGREQKDEARRKKYGIIAKRYDPNAQPWLMKAGKEKVRNFKGTREGSVSENTSYYIFTQCADGAFEAYPIEDWYTFNPVINYKFLNSDEAEIVFEKRDKTFNFFNVMLKKRLRNEEEDSLDAEEGETKVKGKGKAKKDLMLTELEDWSDEEAEMDESDSDDDGEKKAKKAKDDKKKKKNSFRRKNSKRNDLDEAIEESDKGDYDDKEVDYITDNSSESETEKKKNYEDGGVEDEDGLRKINESGGESEEEEQKKEEENAEKKEETKKGSDSESSGPSSGSDDSDPEEASEFTSALFMTNKKEKKSGSKENSASNSRSSTPVNSESNEKLSKKRKATDSPVVPAKRPATSPTPATSSTPEPKAPSSPSGSGEARPAQASPPPSMGGSTSEGLSEENIRRYLMRKPMTTRELLQKFKSKTSMSNEQLVTTLGQMLKKLNPEKKMVKEKMYLSMKK